MKNQPMKQAVKSKAPPFPGFPTCSSLFWVLLCQGFPWFWGTPMDLSFAFGWTFAHQTFGGRPFPRSFRHLQGPGDKLRSMCQWMSVLSIFRFHLHDDMVVSMWFWWFSQTRLFWTWSDVCETWGRLWELDFLRVEVQVNDSSMAMFQAWTTASNHSMDAGHSEAQWYPSLSQNGFEVTSHGCLGVGV